MFKYNIRKYFKKNKQYVIFKINITLFFNNLINNIHSKKKIT